MFPPTADMNKLSVFLHFRFISPKAECDLAFSARSQKYEI